MEMVHSLRDQVLAGDTDVFIGDSPAGLTQFIDTTKATQLQNWLFVWKPFVLSSIQSAKDLSLQGVHTITNYFTPMTEIPYLRALTAPPILAQEIVEFSYSRPFVFDPSGPSF
jgi:hypothetical protein